MNTEQQNLTRLNKAISDTGYCSRREADKIIEQGNVIINGRKGVLGDRVSPEDEILVDGKPLARPQKTIYIAFNKPQGITCTTELHIKDNIINYIHHPLRIFPIGRLDKDSEGLIFLTSDGNIVNKILRAGNKHEKEYLVKINKPVTPDFIARMSAGVPILGTVTNPCFVKQENKYSFRIILTQGLNRQIRRMCTFLNCEVESLKRIRIMNITLDAIATGKWRYFTEEELTTIQNLVVDSVKTEEASTKENL